MIKSISILFLGAFTLTVAITQTDSLVYFTKNSSENSRPTRMIQLSSGNLVWIGQWNDSAIIMKINPEGKILKQLKFVVNNASIMRMRDIVLDNQHIITASDCVNCGKEDSLERVILSKFDTNLVVIKHAVIKGKSTVHPFLYNPSLAIHKKQIMLIASQGTDANTEDLLLASINSELDTVWTKQINSCAACDFEQPIRMTATLTGFATFVYHPFTDTASIYHFDTTGSLLWKQRSYTYTGVAGGAITSLNDKVFIGTGVRGLPNEPFSYTALLLVFSLKEGALLNAITLSDVFSDRTINSLEFAKNGNLIMGYRRAEYTFGGSILKSQILRIDMSGTSPRLLESWNIPNPTENNGMGLAYALPLNADGTRVGAIGFQLPDNWPFYFKNKEKTVPIRIFSSNEKSTLKLFPNPISSNQILQYELSESVTNATLQLIDMQGKIILTKKISRSNTGVLLLPTLAPGIYNIRLLSNKHHFLKSIQVIK